jgi:hypothetical protein
MCFERHHTLNELEQASCVNLRLLKERAEVRAIADLEGHSHTVKHRKHIPESGTSDDATTLRSEAPTESPWPVGRLARRTLGTKGAENRRPTRPAVGDQLREPPTTDEETFLGISGGPTQGAPTPGPGGRANNPRPEPRQLMLPAMMGPGGRHQKALGRHPTDANLHVAGHDLPLQHVQTHQRRKSFLETGSAPNLV